MNFLVGAADKITSILQEHMADSQSTSNKQSTTTSHVDNLSDFEGDLTDEEDDETTLEREEATQQQAHIDLELNELSKEANMEMDEFLTSVDFIIPLPHQLFVII